MFYNIINRLKSRISTRFQPTVQKMCGIKHINEQLDSLYYIVNHGIDIRTFPKATGMLREVQLADTELLRIFHEICEKHQLQYWLDYGTLLGAIRHGGFIPWDDDLDVCMPREDFERATDILTTELKCHGIEVWRDKFIAVTLWDIGVKLDIFAMDYAPADEKDISSLKQKIRKHTALYGKTYEGLFANVPQERTASNSSSSLCFHQIDFMLGLSAFYLDTVFPLKTIQFENTTAYIPCNSNFYLTELYGDYMSFPKNRMLAHKENDIPIYQNASVNGVSIEKATNKLKDIHVQ